MPKLELRSEASAKAPEVTILSISGGLDIATLAELESQLSKLRQEKRMKVVVDLQGLTFISSSGLGAFLSTVNHFRTGGGDLAFTNLSPKIRKVFSMVGFLRVLTVMDDRDAAIGHFGAKAAALVASRFELESLASRPHSGEPFLLTVRALDAEGRLVSAYAGNANLKSGWGIVSPGQIGPFHHGEWSGPVILVGPGEVTLKIHDQAMEGSFKLFVEESKPPVQFPHTVSCPGCSHQFVAHSGDVYRCRQCGEIYLVDKWGNSISLRRGGNETQSAQAYQMLFPSDVNALSHIRGLLSGLLTDSGFDEEFRSDVELAVDEALSNVVEHAYEYDASKSIALRMTVEKDNVAILIRDTGNAFDRKNLAKLDLEAHLRERKPGGLGQFMMENLMDSLDYKCGLEGNTLMMLKRVKSKA